MSVPVTFKSSKANMRFPETELLVDIPKVIYKLEILLALAGKVIDTYCQVTLPEVGVKL